MTRDGTIELDGHTIGYADFGAPSDSAVVWCHGGPGSRLEPAQNEAQARAAGLRLIGIDRPGYGLSDPQPGRAIDEWVPHALAVADHLAVDQFVTVGVSTGGAYALAVGALTPDRVIGVVPCCAMDRHGVRTVQGDDERGTRARGVGRARSRRRDCRRDTRARRRRFAPGRDEFGVAAVRPRALHRPVDVAHARHTATIVPNAILRIVDNRGHFSIVDEVVPTIEALLEA